MGASIVVDQSNFETEVMQKSHEKPVLVDFFATWCGPCQMLKPMLEKLAQEYDFVLAKVDIDQNPELASTYGVEGVPDVKIVMAGEVSDGFVGVLPEPQLRSLMAQLDLKSDLEVELESLYDNAAQGKVEQATMQLKDLLHRYPDSRDLALEAANFYLEADRLEDAEATLKTIPDHEKAYAAAVKSVRALIQFKRDSSWVGDGSEIDRAFQTAAQQALSEQYEAALQGFLEILTRDRSYRDDGARKAMLAIFSMLGDNDPITKHYRKQLTLALY
jgi:putative thioredoxin